jgi:ABC-type multidrug transport system ATPase subunit
MRLPSRRDKPPAAPIELAWALSLTVKATRRERKALAEGQTGKPILTDVVGCVKSGQMMAVMGSSGAGKSSFLDCVSLRNQNFDGHVFVNRKPADESYYFMTGAAARPRGDCALTAAL